MLAAKSNTNLDCHVAPVAERMSMGSKHGSGVGSSGVSVTDGRVMLG